MLKHTKACRSVHDGILLLLTVYVSGVVIATSGRKNAAGCDVASYFT